MATEAEFDRLIETFRALQVESLALEDLAEKANVNLWTTEKLAIVQALAVRGYSCAGMIVRPIDPGELTLPDRTTFDEFLSVAKRIMAEATVPIPGPDLVGMCGLAKTSIPMGSLAFHLKRIGIHYIAGIGFWRSPQYIDSSGRMYARRGKSEKIGQALRLFKEYGWPLTGRDLEALSEGEVSSRFISKHAARAAPDIISVGHGLFVPAAAHSRTRLPMAPSVAKHLLAIGPREYIDGYDSRRFYRIVDWLEGQGLVEASRSTTTRDGIFRRRVRFRWTDAGQEAVREVIARALPNDEF